MSLRVSPVFSSGIGIAMMALMSRRFLTAEWRNLLMVNFAIDPWLVRPLAPRGTEVDFWNGRCFISLVGFLFLKTRVLGLPIPFHRNFEEVNLRFYVGRQAEDGWRRGVVFIREIVPRWAIAAVARWVYNENYVACPMTSEVRLPEPDREISGLARYGWVGPAGPCAVAAEFEGQPNALTPGSEEEFITEHYWGYVSQRDGGTVEYRVAHPSWRVWRAAQARLEGRVAEFYGEAYRGILTQPPTSAFVAVGSEIAVYKGEPVHLWPEAEAPVEGTP